MPAFTIETTFDVPHYRHTTYEATTLEEALALAAVDQEWSHQKADYDSSSAERQTGAWAGGTAYHGTQLIPPPAPCKAEQMEALLRGAIEAFPEFDNDDDIDGSDAIEFLGGFLEDAKRLLGISSIGQDTRACDEGWGLFDVDGKLAIQADSDSEIFVRNGVARNDHAVEFVQKQAAGGSEYHSAALARVGLPA